MPPPVVGLFFLDTLDDAARFRVGILGLAIRKVS